jgi:hypothetical protein
MQAIRLFIARIQWRLMYTWAQPDGSTDYSRPRLR